MQLEGKIADGENVEFSPWEPQKVLPTLTQLEVRLSRGFLCADPTVWVSGLAEGWEALFHSLGVEVRVLGIRKALDFPQDLPVIHVVEVNGEHTIVGTDDSTMHALADAVVPSSRGTVSELAVEYLYRRFLATLSKCWTGGDSLTCLAVDAEQVEEVEVVGSLGLRLDVSGVQGVVWFGIGPRLLEKLDGQWKQRIRSNSSSPANDRASDTVHAVSVQIAELTVPPAMLIDYIRSGTIVDLEIPVSSRVSLLLDGAPWADGELKQFNGMFAVEIRSAVRGGLPANTSSSAVRVELARADLEVRSVPEYEQQGAILLTSRSIAPNASLVIGDETVAKVRIGQIDGRFALNVLAR